MIKAENQKKRKPFTAQDTIPYKEIYKDGICRTDDNYYSKMVQFYDINYQLAQNDDKAAIFENYCEFLNSFDSSVEVQITFLNQQVNFDEYAKNIDIPEQDDCFNDIRKEYSDMLKMQLSKGNNGLVKTKYITFSIKADNLRNAKSRLERIEASVLNNFKVMGAMAEPLNGVERLKILHDVMNMDTKESFHFHYGMVAKTGLQTKDFIAPTGFDFRNDSYFRMGQTFGCVSYLQITSPELTDKLLADLLDLEENLIINMHLRPIDPKPLSDECREVSKRCVYLLGYQGNNLLCSDWDRSDMEGLDYNGLYEYLYRMKYGERYEFSGNSSGIPAEEFENLIMEFLPITADQIKKWAVFDSEHQTYDWERLGCLNYSPTHFGTSLPEVVEIRDSGEGNSVLVVDAVCDTFICNDAVITSELTVKFNDDKSFKYMGNKILNNGTKEVPKYQYRIKRKN